MLIVPASVGFILSKNVIQMILIGALVAVLSSLFGVGFSAAVDGSPGASIVLAAGFVLFLVISYKKCIYSTHN